MQLPVLSAQYLWLRWIFGAVCAAVSLSFYRYVHYYVLTYFCDFIEGEKSEVENRYTVQLLYNTLSPSH